MPMAGCLGVYIFIEFYLLLFHVLVTFFCHVTSSNDWSNILKLWDCHEYFIHAVFTYLVLVSFNTPANIAYIDTMNRVQKVKRGFGMKPPKVPA